jgi:hypothetical protein
LERLAGTLSGQAIKCPEQHYVEATLSSVIEQTAELRAISSAPALMIDVFTDDFPALGRGEPAQFAELIFDFLATIRRADPPINGYATSCIHDSPQIGL